MNQKLGLYAVSFLLLASCSEIKKLDEMKETTTNMKDTTEELYDALRQGNSVQLRREAYESILKAPTLFKKISEANKYMMSFEFQLWDQLGQDAEEGKRDLLGQQAAMEYFMEMEELAPQEVDPLVEPDMTDINSVKNRSASFNSMAVSMHQTNRKQMRVVNKSENLPARTLYTMMEEALLTPRDVAQKGYMREVLAHEQTAIKMLQARYNVFPLIFVNAVSHIGTKNIFAKVWQVKMGWTFRVTDLNATQTEYLQTEVLEHAVAAKVLLEKIGVTPQMNSHVASLLKNMQIEASESAAPSASQEKLLGLLEQLRPQN